MSELPDSDGENQSTGSDEEDSLIRLNELSEQPTSESRYGAVHHIRRSDPSSAGGRDPESVGEALPEKERTDCSERHRHPQTRCQSRDHSWPN